MPQSPHITEFIDDMVRTQGRTRDDVVRELVEVARGAVVAHFGEATPVEVMIEGHDVRVFQVLALVDTVVDPKREITLLAAKRIDPEATTAEQLRVPIRYTYAPEDVESGNVPWKDSVPLPVHDVTLWDVLSRHLSLVLQRYYPPRQHAEGTLGHVLSARGTWTRGVVGRSGATEVAITGAFLDVRSTAPTREWNDYGFDLEVRTAGVTRTLRIERGDNEGNMREQLKLPVSDASRGELEQALAELAAEIETESVRPLDPHLPADWNDKLRFINGHTWTPRLMFATLKRPAPGSLMEHLGPALTAALGDYSCRVQLDGGTVTFRTFRVFPPEIGLGDFGRGALRLAAEIEGGEPAPELGDYTAATR